MTKGEMVKKINGLAVHLKALTDGDVDDRMGLMTWNEAVGRTLTEIASYAPVQTAVPMKLFLVVVRPGWGYSRSLVEASSQEEAVQIANPYRGNHDNVDVEPIELKGAPGIRWCEDVSPDSPRERH